MTPRLLVTLSALLSVWITSTDVEESARRPATSPASDSAVAELAAGRPWHAVRILREDGADRGAPADLLLLARAEAGWENWPAVLAVLEDAPWLAAEGGAQGIYLLGRAFEEAERWAEAANSYAWYASVSGVSGEERIPVLSRLARALWQAGERGSAIATLASLVTTPSVRSWSAVEMTFLAAEDGDTADVRALAPYIVDPAARKAVWRAAADARLAAADSGGAELEFSRLREMEGGEQRAEAATELGRLKLAAGDSSQARALLLEGFERGSGGTPARAADALVGLGGIDRTTTLELARTLDRAGNGARALRAYDDAVTMAKATGDAPPEWARLERARLMGTVRTRQEEALAEFRSLRETTSDDRIGARNLAVWRQMRRRQGLNAQATTLREWLLEEYPSSREALELTWNEGTGAENNGRLEVALARYAFISEHAPESARAGQSRMRSGQILLRRSDREGAAEIFESYLSDFPEGRRWQEAAYWAGRIRLEVGDSVHGRSLLTRAMREQPVEYYAVVAAELLGVPYEVAVPEGERADRSEPLWLRDGVARLDLLTEAGLDLGAETELRTLRQRVDGTRALMLSLAHALIERGRTIDGINLGWALLEQEGSWDQALLRVAFPFPYRELVRREAEEWGVDPLLMAAIIRQESAFKADIVSRAGAVGLMQVMPPTGAELARRHGPSPFSREALASPEVNLHLGAAFFVDMSRRYDDDLPLVLSAYNAGPTRATRWRRFPEASDPLRFTERIPIEETRGYVKYVRRNLGLYRALYGGD